MYREGILWVVKVIIEFISPYFDVSFIVKAVNTNKPWHMISCDVIWYKEHRGCSYLACIFVSSCILDICLLYHKLWMMMFWLSFYGDMWMSDFGNISFLFTFLVRKEHFWDIFSPHCEQALHYIGSTEKFGLLPFDVVNCQSCQSRLI
jgi:hypothetical protein